MNSYEKLPENLIDQSISSDLVDGSIDIAEVGLEQLLGEGFLGALPGIGTFVKLLKGAQNIHDRIFVAKVAKFMFSLPALKEQEINKFVDKIHNDNKFKIKTGETLLLILDRIDDLEKPLYISKIFYYFITGTISFSDFKRLSFAVDQSYIDDLKFLCFGAENHPNEESVGYLNNLIRSGLAENDYGPLTMGGTTKPNIKISRYGEMLRAVMNDELHN